ncbi:MAG: glycosyltransferase [Saprospiraceae bacterium]|nr:glycosyltransferase [Pyrinomonadaceae bacterium]
MKKKIMIFCDSYLPSYKSGGGMWTVVNLVDRFHDRYDFSVVTRNYDSKSDRMPFTSVRTDEWNSCGNANVFYASSRRLTSADIAKRVAEIEPDMAYLNSAFSVPVLKFLFARKKKMIREIPVILAPCGELSRGALSVKPLKKKVFIKYARLFNLYDRLIWKASSDLEADEIANVMGGICDTIVAPDLIPRTILPGFSPERKPVKKKGSVKFIFLSRVVPKKNLLYVLERLSHIRDGEIVLDIVGDPEDRTYWQECLKSISRLPKTIAVNIVGPVSYGDGLELLIANHFFILPTLNENFGYVFIESLAAGCPILISDQTVWSRVEREGSGWVVPLENPDVWSQRIKHCVEMDSKDYLAMSRSARRYAEDWLSDPTLEEATHKVLQKGLNHRAG